jgi:hypothetical protein
MEEEMYEMRIPAGVPGTIIGQAMEDFNLELKHTDDGPVLYGKKVDLENAQDFILKSLNERVKELQGPRDK